MEVWQVQLNMLLSLTRLNAKKCPSSIARSRWNVPCAANYSINTKNVKSNGSRVGKMMLYLTLAMLLPWAC